MKNLANPSQRFVAFLVDTIIIGFITFLLSLLLSVIFRLKEPQFEEIDPHVKSVLVEMINDKFSSSGSTNRVSIDVTDEEIAAYLTLLVDDEDVKARCASFDSNFASKVINSVEDCRNYVSASAKYTLTSALLSFLSYLIIIVLYYDILGYYWSKQTVGRMLMKIKVVSLEEETPTMGSLVLRDLVGFGLFNILNICCFIALIINAIFISRDHISIGDKLSSTRMIRYDEVALNNTDDLSQTDGKTFENNADESQEEIIDAEIVDDKADSSSNNDTLNDSDGND